VGPRDEIERCRLFNALTGADATTQLHRQLLPLTLRNALRTPFYSELWRGLDLETVTVDSLALLPRVSKSDIRNAGRRAQIRDDLICDEIFTSGTTSDPFVSVRGDREQEFIRRFFTKVYKDLWQGSFVRGIQINNPYHGHQVAVPAPIHLHRIGIYDKGSFAFARKILCEPHSDRDVAPHCTILVGLERALRAFAHDTRYEYPTGFPSNLKYIVTYAQYLTRGARALIEGTFGCKVLDRFGMSEVFGGASQHPGSDWYFFDPCTIPEILHPKTGIPLREGRGLLVLTPLFPFQEAQPMVRYDTGDVVEVTHSCPSQPGRLAIKPLGRARYGVMLANGSDWLLTPAEIYEAVDGLPEVQRTPLFRDSGQVRDPYIIGHPRYNFAVSQDSRTGIELIVNLQLRDEIKAEQREGVAVTFLQRLRAESDRFQKAMSVGHANVTVTIGKDLKPHFISYAD
jgi:hypothetical protein